MGEAEERTWRKSEGETKVKRLRRKGRDSVGTSPGHALAGGCYDGHTHDHLLLPPSNTSADTLMPTSLSSVALLIQPGL